MPLMAAPLLPLIVFLLFIVRIATVLSACLVPVALGHTWPYHYVHRAQQVRWRKILTVVSPLTLCLGTLIFIHGCFATHVVLRFNTRRRSDDDTPKCAVFHLTALSFKLPLDVNPP